jgi:uncharacterized membrane protein YbhN (UPF0104 family)
METHPPRPARRLRLVLRGLALGGALAVVLLVVRRMDLRAFLAALRDARMAWVAAAAACFAARLICRSAVWWVSLHVQPAVSLRRLFRYTVATAAASVLTPARAGEALRLWLLQRDHGIPISRSFGVAIGEKLLDLLALLVIVLPLPFAVAGLPIWVARTVLGLVALAPLGLAAAWWFARSRPGAGRISAFLGHSRILREPRTLALAFAVCLGAWLFDLGTLWASLHAVGLREGFGAAAFVLLAINAAVLVPTTPGNLGTLEASAVLALEALHVPRAPALAFALVYHGVQLLPLLVFALLNLRLVLGTRAPVEPPLAA